MKAVYMTNKSVVSDVTLVAVTPEHCHAFFDRSRRTKEIPMPAFPRLHGQGRKPALLKQPFFYRLSAEPRSVIYVVF